MKPMAHDKEREKEINDHFLKTLREERQLIMDRINEIDSLLETNRLLMGE